MKSFGSKLLQTSLIGSPAVHKTKFSTLKNAILPPPPWQLSTVMLWLSFSKMLVICWNVLAVLFLKCKHMSRLMTKPTKWHVCPAKTQISLGICPGVFAVRMKKAWVLSYPLSAQRRLWSDWVDAQADPSLCWAHSHFVGFVMRWLNCLQQEAVGNLRKAQSMYVTRQQEYEKAKELAQKVESDALSSSSSNTSLVSKMDKRKKLEEEAAHKVRLIILFCVYYERLILILWHLFCFLQMIQILSWDLFSIGLLVVFSLGTSWYALTYYTMVVY